MRKGFTPGVLCDTYPLYLPGVLTGVLADVLEELKLKSSFLFLLLFFLLDLDLKSCFIGVLFELRKGFTPGVLCDTYPLYFPGALEMDLSRNGPDLKGFVPTDIDVLDEPYIVGPLRNGLLPILIDEIDDRVDLEDFEEL